MKNIIKCICLILPLLILIVGCNSFNQSEKEYIKNLEEKNRLLEQEIIDLKNNSKNVESVKSEGVKNNDYFTLGSTEKKVIEVMGNPSSYNEIGPFRTMYFGLSSVEFQNGKVTGYDNMDGNLKVKLTE
ncbi:hypothetical protein J8L85_07160 [Maribacter sp. MMG018]|uniref:hypothetical protein n=1 Tax=Maribacter sp. MMG018 TaxID=2822688 RepID=UPI001B35BF41|nr:hypothetical protein [Maribacter sp. MMG018]MBQ4914209.1 hypothetical protein [Maribacter sp. MMG018]